MNPTATRLIRRSFAFSLVELLAVIVIIGILAALGIAAISGSNHSAVNLTGTGGTVSALASLARQKATSLRVRTVLVLAEVDDNGIPRSALSVWDFNATQQLEKWVTLPKSVFATNTSTSLEATTNFPCTYRGEAITGIGYSFFPGGQMGDANHIPRLRLQPRQGDTSNYFELVFNPVTGTAKGVRP